jgi:hypothetical protein
MMLTSGEVHDVRSVIIGQPGVKLGRKYGMRQRCSAAIKFPSARR